MISCLLPRYFQKFEPNNYFSHALRGKIPLKAQSADTFREGSTGTCECTRLAFASATKYFAQGAAARHSTFVASEGRTDSISI